MRLDLTKFQKNCRKTIRAGRFLLCYQPNDDRELNLYIIYGQDEETEACNEFIHMHNLKWNPHLFIIQEDCQDTRNLEVEPTQVLACRWNW